MEQNFFRHVDGPKGTENDVRLTVCLNALCLDLRHECIHSQRVDNVFTRHKKLKMLHNIAQVGHQTPALNEIAHNK